ncbi:MAG: hypothetical protein HDT43_03690 [Ruminococcaceae bacterium]|nr:hypothetical protein [Oscillospiraceae bacterium]
MNGELYQMCSLTAAAKQALFRGADFEFEPLAYENKIEFLFLENIRQCGILRRTAKNAEQWYKYCVKKGLRDIKLVMPTEVKDYRALGFANSSQSRIICYFKNSEITTFEPKWEFDQKRKMWNILYTERLLLIPFVKPYGEDNSDDFRELLIEIGDLAERIGCGNFAKIFERALNILDGEEAPASKVPLPNIPEKYLPLFFAADTADVFGAMGSWNDSPPYMAHEKGLDEEYWELSARLLKNIRLAVFYAINEWR